MNLNDEFKKICDIAMAKEKLSAASFAEDFLNIDPKTFRKYCREGDIPNKIWSKALSLATGEPEEVFTTWMIPFMYRLIYKTITDDKSNK